MSLPEELARTAIAHEEAAPGPGDKVRRTFGVVLARQQTEALGAPGDLGGEEPRHAGGRDF
jgi:hypothetical protein